MRDNLRSISPIGIVQDIVMSDGDLIVELQKEQLTQGKDATGEDIAPSYYSDAYAEMKQELNSQPDFGTPDLRLTGDFHNGFYLDHDTLQVTSSDAKTPSLIEKYGKNIFGLSEKTIRPYRHIFNPKFFATFRTQLAGGNPYY